MNMREKIAKALHDFDYPKGDWHRLNSGQGSYHQDKYRVKADAVLDALAEPTEGMLEAGVLDVKADVSFFEVEETYQAMIRAAKEGK
ncbi:hypothetical protein [Devosia elaeis]|uniref:Uncharacterized protein n=1 Tax=Devosia elaeis TaxID=1770058 RepID=A0A178HZP8_9HYPH|nr:hypothetical protein [Devosia elaeis]OAM78209.1 hypothetical protein A3840_06815 [Devosia elaeis]